MTEEKITFTHAFLAMQAELPVIPKNAENPHFKSKFADLATIVEHTRPILFKHGFTVVQAPSISEDGQPTLKTEVRWIGGGSIQSEMLLCAAKQDPQAQGSAITYARRYAISAILGLVTEEDDDGNAASSAQPAQPLSARAERVPSPVKSPRRAQGTRFF